jgi:hypothetical protein
MVDKRFHLLWVLLRNWQFFVASFLLCPSSLLCHIVLKVSILSFVRVAAKYSGARPVHSLAVGRSPTDLVPWIQSWSGEDAVLLDEAGWFQAGHYIEGWSLK